MPLAAFAVGACACLFAALIEAWPPLAVVKSSDGRISRFIPNVKDSTQIAYRLSDDGAVPVRILRSVSIRLSVTPPTWLVAAACFGAFFNPLGFLICAMRPDYLTAPPLAFLGWMTLSCVATTAGFAAAGWTIAATALAVP